MTPDDQARLLEELPAAVTRRLLESLSPQELQAARDLLGYPPHTAGRYMTPQYVALYPDMTAREALEHIRRTGRGKETLNILYVLDATGKLFWQGESDRMALLGANVNEAWYAMAAAFYTSTEYAAFNRVNNAYVTDLYNTFFKIPMFIVHKNSPPGYHFYSATSGLVPIQGTLGGLTGDPGQFIAQGLNDAGVVVGLASLTDSRGNPIV